MAYQDYFEQVQQLYIAFYQRPADPDGLYYWAQRLEAAGGSLEGIIDAFATSAEAVSLYDTNGDGELNGDDNMTALVTAIYQALFNRAPDAAGLLFYVDALTNGEFPDGRPATPGRVALDILNGAQNDDLIIVNNKTTAAMRFTETLDPGLDGQDYQATYAGDPDAQQGREYLNGVGVLVSSIPTQAETTQFIQDNVADPGDPILSQPSGKIFTLTFGVDGPGALPPSVDTLGTSGNDTYNAVDTTLDTADTLDGRGGTDTLNVRATATDTDAPALANIENIVVTNVGTASIYELNLASATGVSLITSKDQVATSITNFSNVAATGVVGRLDNADGTTQFNYQGAAARTGSSDAVSIEIANGSGTVAAAANLNIVDGTLAAADATFENLNIVTGGAASYVNSFLGAANVRVITVTGDAAADVNGYGLTLTEAANFAAARSVDASGMTGTGGLNVDISAAAFATLTVVGSKNADRVVVDGTTANAANTWSLNGGTGTDTLGVDTLTDFTAATNAGVVQTVNARASSFEVLEATAADVTALKADDFTNIHAFEFSNMDNTAAALAITGVETGDSFKFTTAAVGQANANVVTLSGAVAGQSAIVELNASPGVNAGLTATGTGNALTVNSGITNVTIMSTGSNPGAGNTNTIQSATGVAAIDNVTATNFTITGSQALNIGAAAGVTGMLGFTNAAAVDGSAATGVLRIAGSTVADQIKGGSAADIIYGLGGNDLLTGNGGADQFRYNAAADGTDRITDFTVGTDKIGTNFINFANTTATAGGATLAATDYEDARNDITQIVAGDTLKVIELQTGLTTALITSQLGGAANALVLVFNTTTNKGELWYDTDWSDTGTRTQLATFDNVVDLAGVKAFSNTDFVEFVA